MRGSSSSSSTQTQIPKSPSKYARFPWLAHLRTPTLRLVTIRPHRRKLSSSTPFTTGGFASVNVSSFISIVRPPLRTTKTILSRPAVVSFCHYFLILLHRLLLTSAGDLSEEPHCHNRFASNPPADKDLEIEWLKGNGNMQQSKLKVWKGGWERRKKKRIHIFPLLTPIESLTRHTIRAHGHTSLYIA